MHSRLSAAPPSDAATTWKTQRPLATAAISGTVNISQIMNPRTILGLRGFSPGIRYNRCDGLEVSTLDAF